mmetsp:Transcript_159330/g.281306  ORF Transcript_159330/g.281306 Transcript_159330/m.281306 type:complete len:243 (-) Transcript_159330:68-796(-)
MFRLGLSQLHLWCLLALAAAADEQLKTESCEAADGEDVKDVRSLLHVHQTTDVGVGQTIKGQLSVANATVAQSTSGSAPTEKSATSFFDQVADTIANSLFGKSAPSEKTAALLDETMAAAADKPKGGKSEKASKGSSDDIPDIEDMSKTVMEEEKLPKDSRHVNKKTMAADWMDEYGSSSAIGSAVRPLVGESSGAPPQGTGTCAQDPSNPWCGPYLAFTALVAAGAVLAALACCTNMHVKY